MSLPVRVYDITDILTADELAAIRKHVAPDSTALQNLALRAAAALFDGGREFVAQAGELLYGERQPTDFVNPFDRQVQLLTVFTLSRQWSQLSVHCYWSILIGMSPHDVAMALLLASLQAGIGEYVSALSVMAKVMYMLKEMAPTEPTPEDVLAQLQRNF